MSRQRGRGPAEPPGGEDSLLDVIANLVGVLIILVAIASAASRQHVLREAAAKNEAATGLAAAREELDRAGQLAGSSEQALRELERQTILAEAATQQLEGLRHQLLLGRELALRELRRRAGLAESEAGETELARQEVVSLKAELTRLEERQAARGAARPELRELVHYPTPIAKTVFSDEVHFRLRAGQIDFLPISGLMELMKTRLRSAEPREIAESLTGQVGPLESYRLHYWLDASPAGPPGPNGPQGVLVELKRFELDPLPGHAGEPVATALEDGSRFWTRLGRMRPERTTVSLWVYPDSYPEFLQLRDALRERGYQTAAWPLLESQKVTGGRDGMRTTAQ